MEVPLPEMTVRFERPDWEAIRDSGLMAVDMHFHTNARIHSPT